MKMEISEKQPHRYELLRIKTTFVHFVDSQGVNALGHVVPLIPSR